MEEGARISALERDLESRREFWHGVNNQLQQVVGGMAGMRQLHESNGEKIDTLVDDMAAMKATVERLTTAFPQGDVEGHRRYHEVLIERANLRNELMKQALVKIAQWGGLGLVLWIAHSALESAKHYLKG